MTLLERRPSPSGETGEACDAAGGIWTLTYQADREAVADEVLARNLRGLEVDGGDISFLSRLPDLEFLILASVDLSQLPPLPRLRYLQVTNWSGQLSIQLPSLEWFFGSEGPRGRSKVEAAYSAPKVRSLWLDGMYRDADLVPLAAPHLEALKVWMSSAVTSLAWDRAARGTVDLSRPIPVTQTGFASTAGTADQPGEPAPRDDATGDNVGGSRVHPWTAPTRHKRAEGDRVADPSGGASHLGAHRVRSDRRHGPLTTARGAAAQACQLRI